MIKKIGFFPLSHEDIKQSLESDHSLNSGMKSREIFESMDFYPYVEKTHPEHGKIFDWVFPKEWYRETLNDPYSDQDEEEIPNPEYKPDLNLNMSNRNARIVMDALGIHGAQGEYDTMPIDHFINIARAWLRHSIGHREKGFEPAQTKTDEELYQEASDEVHAADMTLLKRQIERQVEQEVRSRRSDAPDDVIQKLVTMRLRSKMADMTGELYKQKLAQRGPMAYEGGLRDGYVNEQILKMVKIAERGKEMGATHVGIG